MSTTVEELLNEVADAPPCGPDLSSDLAFVQLDQLAQGKPERSSGDSVIPAEPPPWTEVQDRACALLSRSKDLRLAVLLSRAAVALEGFQGLANGLQLIHGL
jgi:type VI secretion system protein ImpA